MGVRAETLETTIVRAEKYAAATRRRQRVSLCRWCKPRRHFNITLSDKPAPARREFAEACS